MSDASRREIEDLDATLASDGQTIKLRRNISPKLIPVDVKCRAFVRGYGSSELIGGITQDQSEVTISPTEIIRQGWPGPWTPSAAEPVRPETDRRVPRKGDQCVIAGRARNIEIVKPIYLDDELVRIDMRVLG